MGGCARQPRRRVAISARAKASVAAFIFIAWHQETRPRIQKMPQTTIRMRTHVQGWRCHVLPRVVGRTRGPVQLGLYYIWLVRGG